MRSVAVIGIGKTPFGAFPDRDLRSLAVESGRKALANAGIEPGQVEAFYLGNFAGPSFVGQSHLAPFIAGPMGISGVPFYIINDKYGVSGAQATETFVQAFQNIGKEMALAGGEACDVDQKNC